VVTEGASGGASLKFAPQGITDAPNTFAEGKRLVKRLQEGSRELSVDQAEKIVSGLLRSGAERPTMLGINPGEKLFKAVPKGQPVGARSPFFFDEATKERLRTGDANIADVLGLPKASEASIYDIYSVTPKPGEYPSVFKSTVARTIEGDVRRSGGEDQALIVNRQKFTEPELEFELPERER